MIDYHFDETDMKGFNISWGTSFLRNYESIIKIPYKIEEEQYENGFETFCKFENAFMFNIISFNCSVSYASLCNKYNLLITTITSVATIDYQQY